MRVKENLELCQISLRETAGSFPGGTPNKQVAGKEPAYYAVPVCLPAQQGHSQRSLGDRQTDTAKFTQTGFFHE